MSEVDKDHFPNFQITLEANRWRVGYSPEHDEMFLLKIDSDGLISVYRKGGLDSQGFEEFMDFSKAELLGEL